MVTRNHISWGFRICDRLSKLQICVLGCLTCLVYYIFCFTQYGHRASSWYHGECEKRPLIKGYNKTVLMWTTYFSEVDSVAINQLSCPQNHCLISTDRNLWSESSAIVLHWRGLKKDPEPYPPRTGKNCPILVLYNRESPEHTPIELIESIKEDIDWVASYRRDSDFYAPYGWFVEKTSKAAYELPDLKTKQTAVCWLVSNCETPSKRELYVEELEHHISIEQYGKCNNASCPYNETLDCYKWLSTRCKFYLAFENSICKDYATEKLYNSMMTGMIPIVMGGNNYRKFLPNHSYIDVDDFKSAEELAHYLLELDKDDRKYLEYFEWRRTRAVTFELYNWVCDLCAKLEDISSKELKSNSNFVSWWYDGGHCRS